MNEQNITENNEVMEVAEEIANSNSGLGFKIIGGVVVAAGLIYGGLKLRKKIKAKKEDEGYTVVEATDDNVVEFEEAKDEKENTKKKK